MSHNPFIHHQICNQCGQQKPRAAFAYLDHDKQILYGIICSTCRSHNVEEDASSNATDPKLRLAIDNNAKIYQTIQINRATEKTQDTKVLEKKKKEHLHQKKGIKEQSTKLAKKNAAQSQRSLFDKNNQSTASKSEIIEKLAAQEHNKTSHEISFKPGAPTRAPTEANRKSSTFFTFLSQLGNDTPLKRLFAKKAPPINTIQKDAIPKPSAFLHNVFQTIQTETKKNTPANKNNENQNRPQNTPLNTTPHKK